MEVNPLIPIGTKIKVDKSKMENLIQTKFMDNLPQTINGEIVDYKMTDGQGIGYVLMTDNNKQIWIFNTELNAQIRKEYKIEVNNKYYIQNSNNFLFEKYKINYEINGNRSIRTTANPINLIYWLIYTLKDIF